MQVASMCQKGLGTPPDFPRTVRIVRELADKADPAALETLAAFYAAALAEPRGPEDKPIWLLRKAAVLRANTLHQTGERSNPLIEDCRELWSRYRYGIGTPRDYVATAEWMWLPCQDDFRRGAGGQRDTNGVVRAPPPFEPILKGSVPATSEDERLWHQAVRLAHEALDELRPEAWHRIGESYRDGSTLTPKQVLFAWGWFNRGAELGHAPAREALNRLEADLTADELFKAKNFWVPPLAQKQ
jgi:TPR repeat protein